MLWCGVGGTGGQRLGCLGRQAGLERVALRRETGKRPEPGHRWARDPSGKPSNPSIGKIDDPRAGPPLATTRMPWMIAFRAEPGDCLIYGHAWERHFAPKMAFRPPGAHPATSGPRWRPVRQRPERLTGRRHASKVLSGRSQRGGIE